MSNASAAYRPDIDGLRGLSVLAVIFFHAQFPPFSGGFVGVDMFFVISGYLITKIIRREVSDGTFRFSRFYMRRARRLLPSLTFTLLLCVVPAYILMTPQQIEGFVQSLIFAILSLSNFFFLSEVGYFDAAADYKPLLHLWSLSVEEQFYIVWPLTLVLLMKLPWRTWGVPLLMVAAAVASLYLNRKAVDVVSFFAGTGYFDVRSTIFYVPAFRAYEFIIGGVLVWIERDRLPGWLRDVCAFVGLCLIGYAMIRFSSNTLIPSHRALVPCLGTALLIYAQGGGRLRVILTNPPLVRVGLVSYSLYLIHWPIFVFYKYYAVSEIGLAAKVVLCLLSLLAAELMYRYVERPFRAWGRFGARTYSPAILAGLCALSVLLAVLPQSEFYKSGLSLRAQNRYPEVLATNLDQHYAYLWRYYRDRQQIPFDRDKLRILVVGDSQSADLLNLLVEGGLERSASIRPLEIDIKCGNFLVPDAEWAAYTDAEKQLKEYPALVAKCVEDAKAFYANPLIRDADMIVLASAWQADILPFLSPTIAALRKLSPAKIAVVGRKDLQAGSIVLYANYVKFEVQNHRFDDADLRRYASGFRNANANDVNRRLAQLSRLENFTFIDLSKAVCPAVDQCLVVTRQGQPMFFDNLHLTQFGAEELGRVVVDTYFR